MERTPDSSAPKENFWKELLKLAAIAAVVVIPFRLYIAQPFIVEGTSMDPTFKNGHYLIVDELSYRFNKPERGDVLIFRYPREPKRFLIKRVIGLPGEIVRIKDGKVSIISGEYPDGLAVDEPYVKWGGKDTLTYTLAQGEYFVMGDNRLASSDSRIWGPVPEANIIGRPILRFFPPTLFPGDDSHFSIDNET